MGRERCNRMFARMLAGVGLAAAISFGIAGPASAASPFLNVNPQLFDFNYVEIGSQSGSANFTIKNRGEGAATMGTVSMVGDAPEQYFIASEDCSSRTLRGLGICNVAVRFRPTVPGNHRATLQIEADYGQTRLVYMLGSARRLTGQGPPMGTGKPSAACVKANKRLPQARQRVRQTKRRLRVTKTKSRRRAIRKRLVRQQWEVLRSAAQVDKRCGPTAD